jgi:hemin uptake protein HemP
MTPPSGQEDGKQSGKENRTSTPVGRTITVVGGRIDSRDLFVGTREIIIGHGSDIYRLRLTAQNKLILTK